MNHLRFFDVFFTALFLQVTFFSFTQNVAINSTGVTAHSSAILDITATDKGILIPRVSLTAANVAAPVTSPATSLLVYNTNSSGTGSNVVGPGFYYWDGSMWRRAFSPNLYAGKVNFGDVNGTATVPIVEGYIVSATRSNCNNGICLTINFPALVSTNYVVEANYSMITGVTPNTAGSNGIVEGNNDQKPITVYDKTISSFRVYIEETNGIVQQLALDILIVPY